MLSVGEERPPELVISLVVDVVGVIDDIIVEWVRKGGVLKSLSSLLLKGELSPLIHEQISIVKNVKIKKKIEKCRKFIPQSIDKVLIR